MAIAGYSFRTFMTPGMLFLFFFFSGSTNEQIDYAYTVPTRISMSQCCWCWERKSLLGGPGLPVVSAS